MNNLVKSTQHSSHRVHAPSPICQLPTAKPLCGGGNGAKSAHWQEDIGECNCRRCLAILERQARRTQPATTIVQTV